MLGLIDALEDAVLAARRRRQAEMGQPRLCGSGRSGDADAALRDGKEFLGSQARDADRRSSMRQPRSSSRRYRRCQRRPAHVRRHRFRQAATARPASPSTSATIEAIREEHERTVRSHADTLDQLTTAVAIFDADQRLRFFNQAFQKLWDLDTVFLDSAPDNALLLDRLRSDGKIAEQPEWRRWKENLLAAYRAVDPQEHWWHLPDGRTIRVVANPQPQGRRHLGVREPDRADRPGKPLPDARCACRARRSTIWPKASRCSARTAASACPIPAFCRAVGLEADARRARHARLRRSAPLCDGKLAEDSPWPGFVAAVTGFDDERRDRHGQTELNNGTCCATP